MRLLTSQEFFELPNLSIEELPFCFQPAYVNLYSLVFLHTTNVIAPVKISRQKFLKTFQFYFPPITLSGIRLSQHDEKVFCERAIKFIKDNKLAHRILQPKNFAFFSACPSNTVHAPFGTYRVMLSNKTQHELLENMQARYRSAIREISKLNVEIKFGIKELNAFYTLHTQTMKRTNAYEESLDDLKKELTALPNNTLLATIYIDDKLQGGLYLVLSKYSAFYFYGASASTTIASGAIKYLHFKCMSLMLEKNIGFYDFVGARLTNIAGTKLEGIQNFKKRFGSELLKGYLWKMDINKSTCFLYDNLLKLRCKLSNTTFPIDIIDQEKNKLTVL